MSRLFQFSNTIRRDPDIEAWMREHEGDLGTEVVRVIYAAYVSAAEGRRVELT